MPNKSRCFHLECKVAKAEGNKAEIMIYSSISSYKWSNDDPTVTSRDFDKDLKALGDVDEITVRINSPGGAVNEAIAIRTALMKHKSRKCIDIEGSCNSAATLIACTPGAHVRMAKGSDYMIHRCTWAARGNMHDMLSAYNSMVNTDNDMADIYAQRTGMTRDECLALMDKTTWYTAESAQEAGFVDEVFSAKDEGQPMVAFAMDEAVLDLMKACYANVPEHDVKDTSQPDVTGNGTISNEKSAVAAGDSSENTGETRSETEEKHMEIKGATAESIRKENPEAANAIAAAAVEDERKRRKAILTLKPRGEKWNEMAERAIANGDSEADFLRAVIAEQEKTGEEYLEKRSAETRSSNMIGAGDPADHDDDSKEAEDKFAKEIAELAKSMGGGTVNMA